MGKLTETGPPSSKLPSYAFVMFIHIVDYITLTNTVGSYKKGDKGRCCMYSTKKEAKTEKWSTTMALNVS